MQFFLFLALILALALVLFAVQNSIVISLKFVNWSFEGSLAFILSLTFVAGMIAGMFLLIPAWWRKAMQGRVQRKRIHELEKELSSLAEEDEDESELDGIAG
ncbi:MAG: LapA family protein [Candidatus Mariimomonas ferrooxydans]